MVIFFEPCDCEVSWVCPVFHQIVEIRDYTMELGTGAPWVSLNLDYLLVREVRLRLNNSVSDTPHSPREPHTVHSSVPPLYSTRTTDSRSSNRVDYSHSDSPTPAQTVRSPRNRTPLGTNSADSPIRLG